MKRILLVFGLCFFSFSAQAATCSVTSPLAKDATGTPQTFNVPYADDGSGSGACEPQIQIKQGNNVAAVTSGGAIKTDATATNQPVTQSGTWNVTNVSGTVSLPTGAATAANQATEISSLATIATNTGAAVPAGTNIVGKFGIDQTTPGTTNGVQVNAALPAGTNLLGKTGIDQTTPGTTNGVALVGVNGATALAGNGTTGTGSPRVTIASDNTAFAVNAQYGGTALVADPCQANSATWTPISITTATTTKIVTGTSGKKLYVCYLYLQTAAANNIAVISGTTGGTCGSNTAGLIGGTTAANGLNNAANSGQAVGTGGFAVSQVATNNDDICLITSASTPLAGVIKTVVQ